MDEAAEVRVAGWLVALEERHLAELTLPEVRRALQALSSLYVGRRLRIAEGAALDGAGKRAAFALFYGPLHFLQVRDAVRRLGAADPPPARIADLGCGTGASGAAWSIEAGGAPLAGSDRNAWAVGEANWTWATLGLPGRARRESAERARLPGTGGAALLAWTANELDERVRDRLLERLLEAAGRGMRVLVVEPASKRSIPWWNAWVSAFRGAGGREDLWRLPAALPELVRRLDRAAGLDHRELVCRTLWIPA
jgi:hypothetical protein